MAKTVSLAVAQIQPVKGDYPSNLAKIAQVVRGLGELDDPPEVIQFPESALSGYFVEGGVREVAVTAGTLAEDLDGALRDRGGVPRVPVDVVVGFYERWRETLYNSAAYLRLGEGAPRVVHVHRKVFLPTYGLFDEERFVERGHDLRAFDTPWGRAAMLVCEDAWHSLSGTIVALDAAEVVFLVSAAPARGVHPRAEEVPGPASAARWERLLREMGEEHGVFVSFANLVGSEGGKVFAGSSAVFGPRGELRARAPQFEEAILRTRLDLGDLGRARADTPLLADLRSVLPRMRRRLEELERGALPGMRYDPASVATRGRAGAGEGEIVVGGGAPPRLEVSSPDAAGPHRRVSIPIVSSPGPTAGGPPPLEIDAELVERWLTRFLRDEMRRRGLRHTVVGLSGGVDSAVTTSLAARALGPENVLAVRMPYRTSSPESMEHALLVIQALGVPERTIDITPAVDGYLANEPEADAGRRGNVMARLRMVALFDQSARLGGVPLGTGNKSERLLGYFTWHADDSPPINPLGDLFKTQVWALARHLGIPGAIVDKPPTADLVAGQTDEGDFGVTYEQADEILNWLVAGYTARELVARGFDAGSVERVSRRLDGTHWKRRLPTVALMSQSAIGESYLRPVDY